MEVVILSLVFDLFGGVGALKAKTQVLALFIVLQTMVTLLVAFQSLSLFLVARVGQLGAALMLRAALFTHEVSLSLFWGVWLQR